VSQQINLFNPIFLKQKKYFSAVTMAQALGMVLLGSLALSGYTNYQVSRLSEEAQATSAQLAAVQAQLAKVNAAYGPRQKNVALDEELKTAEFELDMLQRVTDILKKGEIGDTRGYSEYMRAFSRQIMPGVWLTGFSITGAGSEITLQGRTLKPELVPAYLGQLKREPALQGKSFSALEMQLPKEERPAVAATAQPAAPTTAPYIEFHLRSAGMDAPNAAGAKSK